MPLESLVGKDDAQARVSAGDVFRDQHNIVEVGDAGFQQHQLLTGLAPAADIPKENRESIRKRIGAQLKPDVERWIKRFKLDLVIALHRGTNLVRKRRIDGARKFFPETLSQQLFAMPFQQPLALAIHVGKAPVVVQGVETITDAVQGDAQPCGQPLRIFPGVAHQHLYVSQLGIQPLTLKALAAQLKLVCSQRGESIQVPFLLAAQAALPPVHQGQQAQQCAVLALQWHAAKKSYGQRIGSVRLRQYCAAGKRIEFSLAQAQQRLPLVFGKAGSRTENQFIGVNGKHKRNGNIADTCSQNGQPIRVSGASLRQRAIAPQGLKADRIGLSGKRMSGRKSRAGHERMPEQSIDGNNAASTRFRQ